MSGAGAAPSGIRAEQMTDKVWDYIFLKGEMPIDTGIEPETLQGVSTLYTH
jgi:hypothetical protein